MFSFSLSLLWGWDQKWGWPGGFGKNGQVRAWAGRHGPSLGASGAGEIWLLSSQNRLLPQGTEQREVVLTPYLPIACATIQPSIKLAWVCSSSGWPASCSFFSSAAISLPLLRVGSYHNILPPVLQLTWNGRKRWSGPVVAKRDMTAGPD